MTPDSLPKRVFFCLLIIIIFIGFMTSGCHSTKWEWLPKDKTQTTKDEKETGVIKGTVLKVSF